MTSGIANAIRNWRVNPTFGERSQSRRVLENESTPENGKFCSQWNGLDILGRPVDDSTFYDVQLGCLDQPKIMEREVDVERPKYFELITLNNDGLLTGGKSNPKGIPHFGITSPIAALKPDNEDDAMKDEGDGHFGPSASSILEESYPKPEDVLRNESIGSFPEEKTSPTSATTGPIGVHIPTTTTTTHTNASSLAASHQRISSTQATARSAAPSPPPTKSPSHPKQFSTAYTVKRSYSNNFPRARSDFKTNNYAMISNM